MQCHLIPGNCWKSDGSLEHCGSLERLWFLGGDMDGISRHLLLDIPAHQCTTKGGRLSLAKGVWSLGMTLGRPLELPHVRRPLFPALLALGFLSSRTFSSTLH